MDHSCNTPNNDFIFPLLLRCSQQPQPIDDEISKLIAKKQPKRHKKKHRKNPNIDPYAADDEDEDFLRTKRHNHADNFIDDANNQIVMKVVKQGDYSNKQFHNQRSGSLRSDVEQEFFLPRNVSSYNLRVEPPNLTSSIKLKQINSNKDDSGEYSENEHFDEDITDTKSGVERAKTKAVFEVPRKPISNYR